MTERKTSTQLSNISETANNVSTQDQTQTQRTPTAAFPSDPFNATSPSTAFPPMFEDPTPSSIQTLGQDQPFLNLPGGMDGVPSGSLLSPIRFFPSSTPTGWSPRFNLFSMGTPFSQSPTSGFPLGFSPFCQTPTGGLQPQQITTPNSNKQPFKMSFPQVDNKLGTTVVGVSPMKKEQDSVPQPGPIFPQLPQFTTIDLSSASQKGTFPTSGPESSPAPTNPAASPQTSATKNTSTKRRNRRMSSPPADQPAAGNQQQPQQQQQPSTAEMPASASSTPSPNSTSTPTTNTTTARRRQNKRPPPLNVSPRNAELNTVDVPMSSFKLVVGAQKLCKFRRYAVTLTVPKTWRVESGLTEEKVMKALLDAKCCRSGTAVIAGCPRCKCQPVVTLVATTKWPQASSVSEGNEHYTCSIRTRCSSSRDHLKSSLTLVLDGLPLPEYIVSNSFVLLARDKSQAPKRFRSFDFSQSGAGFPGTEDEDDGKGHSTDGDVEMSRKPAHRANMTVNRRRQQQNTDAKTNTKVPPTENAASFNQKQAKNDTVVVVPAKKEAPSFPPVPATTTFPSAALRQDNAVAPTSGNTSSSSNASSSGGSSNGSANGDYAPNSTSSSRTNPEGMYNAAETGRGTNTTPSTTDANNRANVVYQGSGGKTPSPIQPSSASLPSPTPCSTPTGMFIDAMTITNYDGMEQMGWPLSPIMTGPTLLNQ